LAVLEETGPAIDELLPGTWHAAVLRVFTGVAAAVMAGDTTLDPGERRRLRRVLAHQRDLAARWTAKGGNFEHVAALLDAEQSRLTGRLDEAAQLYVRARELAAAQRNPMLEALVCERTATLLTDRGWTRMALGPLLDARERWCQWGAFAKVAQLDAQWPQMATIAQVSRPTDERTDELTTSESTTSRALDTATLVGISQAIAEDIELADVVERVLALAVENVGAERGALLLVERGELHLTAEWTSEGHRAHGHDASVSLSRLRDRLPSTVLRWVERTAEPIVLDDAGNDLRFSGDPYLRSVGAGSVLCTPIIKHGRLIGLLYLENRLSSRCFTAQRLEILRLLAAQAASALDNARLYADLRASEVRWRSLVQQLPDHVVLVDRDGTVEFANRSVPLDADGNQSNPLELMAPESRREVSEALAKVFATGVQQSLEVEWRSKTGEQHVAVVRIAPIVLDHGPARVIAVTTDVSERRRLEARVRQQQRLEAMGTLAAGVAHEINNPVQGILNYAELIASAQEASPLIREFASEIEHETDRVATIVRNLLRFSRQEQHEAMEEQSLARVVEGTISLLRALLRRSQIQLELRIPDHLPRLTCRPQQIQQVVMNLVTNARDALDQRYSGYHADKRVEIEGSTFERDARRWLKISVSDHGGGIPEAVAARIFDPFFTTKGRDRGTGLGLAVSHGIVRDHGGELVLHNRPGFGANFVIELPCSPV
jgi:PAS domain S-box-containing protein